MALWDQHLWDKLTAVHAYNKHGQQQLQAVKHFSQTLVKLLHAFADGLKKSAIQLETDAAKHADQESSFVQALSSTRSGIDALAQQIEESTQQILGDLVEPLATFYRVHSQETQDLLLQADREWDQFQEHTKTASILKEKYFELKWEVEKCEINLEESMLALERGFVPVSKVQQVSQQGMQVKYKAEVATHEYTTAVAAANKTSKALLHTLCPILLKLQQSEEARINFLKQSLKKYARHIGRFGSMTLKIADALTEKADIVNAGADLRMFATEHFSGDTLPLPEMVVEVYHTRTDVQKYKQELAARQVLEAADAEGSDEEGVLVFAEPADKVKVIVQALFEGNALTAEDTGYILESCKLPEVRDTLALFFRSVTSMRLVSKKDCFVVLGWLCYAFLDQLDLCGPESLGQLESLMQMSVLVYIQEARIKVLLASELESHRVWRQKDIWARLIQNAIDQKTKPTAAKVYTNTIAGNLNYATSNIKMGIGALRGLAKNLTGQPVQAKEKPIVPQNVVFNTQSGFIKYFVSYNLAFEDARALLIQFSSKYEFDKSRTHLLLSELEQVQQSLPRVQDRKLISDKRKQRLEQYGVYAVLKLVLPFINTDQTLARCLVLNKASHSALRRTVYKHALLSCQTDRLIQKRRAIWSQLLELSSFKSDYWAFQQKVKSSPELIKNVEEVIMLDVQRSAHSMPCVDMQVLASLLKTYAFYNPEIEYCQGMNYIGGFLLAYYKDEEAAFKVLQSLAGRYKMAELFNPDIPRLKLFFLQMDRMLSYVDLELHTQFQQEDVTASYFASAWFITIFTNSLNKNTADDGTVNESLLQLWDYFLVAGWKAILKLGLYILTKDHDQLVDQNFEGILTHIAESPKRILSPQAEGPRTLYQEMTSEFKRVPVTFLLGRMQDEFEKSHSM